MSKSMKIYIKNVQDIRTQLLQITSIIVVGFKQRRVWLDPRQVCLNSVVQNVALE